MTDTNVYKLVWRSGGTYLLIYWGTKEIDIREFLPM